MRDDRTLRAEGDYRPGIARAQRFGGLHRVALTGQFGRLDLVRHDQVDRSQKTLGQRHHRSRGEHGEGPGGPSESDSLDEHRQRQLALHHEVAAGLDGCALRVAESGDGGVRAGHDDDRVLSGVDNRDVRGAGGGIRRRQTGGADALGLHQGAEL